MKNLMKAEWFKLKKITTYRMLLILYLLIEVADEINKISNSVVYPKYNPSYTGIEWLLDTRRFSLFSIVVFLFAVSFVKGDFSGHIFYSFLSCGITRRNAFGIKLISTFTGGIPLILVSVLPGIILWSIHAGFGMNFEIKAVFLIIKSCVIQMLFLFMLITNVMFFAVLAKNKISTFVWSFGSLYVLGIFRGNIESIVPIPALREVLLFILSLPYLNVGTFLASVLLKLWAAGYIFEKMDLR